MSKLQPIIEEAMIQYSGAVLQNRALVDVRDGLKPSARQIFYSMLLHKLTYDKPYKKTANAVGMAMADFYIHGDSSCEGVIMRAGQPFAMRYPLVDVKGNAGSLIASGNWAAMRYTESKLSKLLTGMFNDIEKDTISEWRDSYDNTKQFPAVLPTKGFYNLCNGSMGIGIGMASCIPQFNIKDMNKALINLINNPDCSFDDIYCAPDFATGAILLNEDEVKESLKNGNGFACKLRSVVEFDTKERCLVVTEIPYGVYTNTICGELEKICNSDQNPGIERINDLTGATPLIKIYLTRQANPDKVLKFLYKETSLQYYYSINLTMLDSGRFPRVFTWKEALQAHIDHEKEVYRRGFEFDLNKIKSRIHIIDGLLICLASIEEVVKTIKSSSSTASASIALQKQFLLDEVQAKAVLDMKLSRLAHLEVQKLQDEKVSLEDEAERINAILNDEQLFNNELINGWRETANTYGDERRTKILSLSSNGDEPIEVKTLQISLTNQNNLFVAESSTLYTQKRGGVGSKIKLDNGEYVISSLQINSDSELLLFSTDGNYYHCSASNLEIDTKTSIHSLVPLKDWQKICAMNFVKKNNSADYILFFTKNGMVKKSELSEYNITKQIGMRALALEDGDEIVSIVFTNTDEVGILTNLGNFVIITTEDIRPIGRIAKGIRVIKLNPDDYVQSAGAVPQDTRFIASISGNGLFKQTPIKEFTIQGKNTKGSKLQKLNEGDWMADFYPLRSEASVLIASTRSCLKLSINDIPTFSKGALGNKSIKLTTKDNVVKILGC